MLTDTAGAGPMQAERAGADKAGSKASADRREGTMEARQGETPQAARCAALQRDPDGLGDAHSHSGESGHVESVGE